MLTDGELRMADKQQQHNSRQSNERRQAQPSEQSTQEIQRSGGRQQSGLARREGFLPSMFNMDPFDMFRMPPFALMRRFTEEMDQYFDQLWSGRREPGMAAAGGRLFSPPMEVSERDGQLMVCVDLPGLTKDDVRVEVTDNALLIEGERRSEHEERQGGIFRSERGYGTFRRQIPLPEGVNADQATATFKDGVLMVTMPAPQQQKRGRRIEIHSANAPGSAEQAASAPQGQERVETTAR
jgi:HSP20 family protein